MKAVWTKYARKTLPMMMAVIMSTSTLAWGQGKTVEVKGYIEEGSTQEQIKEAEAQYSVSNVVDTFDAKKFDEEFDAGLVVEPSSKITVLEEVAGIFEVVMLTKTGEYNYEKEIPMSGPVKISIFDETGALDEDGYPKLVQKTIDASKLGDYEDEGGFPLYLPGCSFTLTEPGDYYVTYREEAHDESAYTYIKVVEKKAEAEKPKETTVTAKATNSRVLVNGSETSFEAYNIKGSNYFKLRDLAKVVGGTEKQFEVSWDGEKKAINLLSGRAYTSVGGELAKGDGINKTGSLNTSAIYKDGKLVELEAYNIKGNNYFKLRDIASTFDIGVTWDGQTNTVGIDTSIGYLD